MPLIPIAVVILIYIVMTAYRRVQFAAAVARLGAIGAAIGCDELSEPVADTNSAASTCAELLARIRDEAGPEVETLSHLLTGDLRRERPRTWVEARQVVERHADLFSSISRNAEWVGQEATTEQLIASGGPGFEGLRAAVHLLSARAVLRAADGDTDGAVDDVVLSLSVSRTAMKPSALISFLVRQALIKISLSAICGVLEQGDAHLAQAKRLFNALSSIDVSDEFVEAMRGEAAFAVGPDSKALSGWLDAFCLPIVTASCLSIARHIGNAGLTYPEALAAGLLEQPGPLHSLNPVPSGAGAIHRRVNLCRYMLTADLACCTAFLAACAHRSLRGAWPKSLEEARAGTGWSMQADPFTGRDLVYDLRRDEISVTTAGPPCALDSFVSASGWQSGKLRLDIQFGAPAAESQGSSSIWGRVPMG